MSTAYCGLLPAVTDFDLVSPGQRHGWSAEEAVELMRSQRPHVLLGPKQWSALYDYARWQRSPRSGAPIKTVRTPTDKISLGNNAVKSDIILYTTV